MKLMRQQVLRSGPNGENISVGRREDRERLTITMKEKEGRGSSKSVVLRVELSVDVIVE